MSPVSQRILLVEDDQVDQLAFRRLVKTEALDYDYQIARSVAEARRLLVSGRFDVVVTDYNLGDGTAFDLFETAFASGAPVIMTTGQGDEAVAVKAMKLGADDYLVKDLEGHYLQILPITIDKSIQRKQVAAALRESQELYRLITENANDVIGLIDASGRFAYVSPSVQRLLGYAPEQLLGTPAIDLIQPDDPAAAEFAAQLQSGQAGPLTYRGRHADGSGRWLESNAALVERGGQRYFLTVARDISARRSVEADLRQSEERFAKAFRASPLALTITRSADRLFIDVNEGFLALFGYRRDEIVGRSANELNFVPDAEERADMLRHFNEHGAIHNYETVRRTKSGALRHVLLSADSMDLNGEAHTLTTMLDVTDRKQAEAALRESETKFRTLFEVLPVGVSILNDQRRVVDSNSALGRIMHLTDEGLASGAYNGRSYIYPDGTPVRPEDFPSLRVLREQRPILHVEMGGRTESGDMIWVDVSASPLPVAGFSAVVVIADLTERKSVEAALRQSEEKFSKAFHASGAGIVISRLADGRILEANDSYLRLVGYEREEVIGRTTLEIKAITPAVRELLVASAREHGHIRDMEIGVQTKSGAARTVVTSSETILIEGEQCLLSILYDVTERKSIEQALAHERDQLQALMDNIPDTIYFKDRASRFTRVNQAQARMLGIATPQLAVGKSDADFQATHLAGEFYAEEQRLLDAGQPLLDRLEFNPTPAGEPRWLSATKVPLKDASGQVTGLVGISRDVTRRVRAEEDLQRLNQQLADRVHELSVLNMLEEQLQACQTVDETFPLAAQFMSQLFPGHSGALYIVNAERTQVTTAGTWGVPALAPQDFGLDDCWSLRRGQLHVLDQAHPNEPCRHLADTLPAAALCVPLLTGGEALGVLHLRAPDGSSAEAFAESTRQLGLVVADSVALTWANLLLRETLRQQAIRDPLTGVYNRRFMEESLARELNRSARLQQGLSLIMMDVDSFKQVNDHYGHETGDAVLRALGALLAASSRGSDIPCRFGGEEFLLILPDAPLEIARQRAEQLRAKFRQVSFGVNGRQLNGVTLSLGVAAFPQHGEALEAVLRAADGALYRAKSEGKDRTIVAAV